MDDTNTAIEQQTGQQAGLEQGLKPRRSGLCAATIAAVLALASSSAVRAANDDSEPSAVPYRPSVSTPANLSAPGWLEVEAGLTHEHDGPGSRRDSLPVTLKLAFTPDWGVLVGADAWVRRHDDSGRHSGVGDTAVVLKRRFAVDATSAFGLEAAAVLPSSRHGLGTGSGRTDYGVNAIYSADFDDWHTDLNLAATRLGAIDAGTGRVQWLGAASLSRSLGDRWGITGELSGTRQSGSDSSRQLLLAASYNVSKRLVLDAGATRSLHGGAPNWSAFTGFTWLAARLF